MARRNASDDDVESRPLQTFADLNPTGTAQVPGSGFNASYAARRLSEGCEPQSDGGRSSSVHRLNALTGLRFLAALHVVWFHFFPGGWMEGPGPVRNIATSGFVAVSFFYVLSGFILTYTHAGDAPSRSARRAFYVARVARIAPVYYIALFAGSPFFVSAALKQGHLVRSVLEAGSLLTFTNAYLPSLATSVWNPAAWSLSVEAFFYVLFPFVVQPILRQAPRSALLLLLAMWLLSIVPALVLVWFSASPSVDSGGFSFFGLVRYNPVFRLPEFIAGCALGSVFRNQEGRARGMGILAALAGAALIGVLMAADRLPYMLLNSTGLLVPLYAALIFALAHGRGFLSRVLGSAVLVRLGDASYSLYMFQFVTWYWLAKLVSAAGRADWPGSPGFFALYLVATLTAVLIIYQKVEVPMRKSVKHLLNGSARVGP
jgi:peptidoglycan/LPS O-acetylase OafA/YrhL